MNDTIFNKIYLTPSWGLFVGKFDDNILHKHYAIQISLASRGHLTVTDQYNTQKDFTSCYINSNVLHQFTSAQTALIILINPLSSVGHMLSKKYQKTSIGSLSNDLKKLSDVFNSYLLSPDEFTDFTAKIDQVLMDFKCGCEANNHIEDDRIYKAIQYLEQNFERVVSLKEIANNCFLSETRFLHLFKEQTNLNFRRYQIWNRLIKSLALIHTQPLIETAHQFGFTDSSHYNRTFKETFGLSPKLLSKLK